MKNKLQEGDSKIRETNQEPSVMNGPGKRLQWFASWWISYSCQEVNRFEIFQNELDERMGLKLKEMLYNNCNPLVYALSMDTFFLS